MNVAITEFSVLHIYATNLDSVDVYCIVMSMCLAISVLMSCLDQQSHIPEMLPILQKAA